MTGLIPLKFLPSKHYCRQRKERPHNPQRIVYRCPGKYALVLNKVYGDLAHSVELGDDVVGGGDHILPEFVLDELEEEGFAVFQYEADHRAEQVADNHTEGGG